MPLVALFAVAGGIALALALAGRRLHDLLLADVLSGHRTGIGRLLLTAGMSLLVLALVLLGAAVAFLSLLRGLYPKPMVP